MGKKGKKGPNQPPPPDGQGTSAQAAGAPSQAVRPPAQASGPPPQPTPAQPGPRPGWSQHAPAPTGPPAYGPPPFQVGGRPGMPFQPRPAGFPCRPPFGPAPTPGPPAAMSPRGPWAASGAPAQAPSAALGPQVESAKPPADQKHDQPSASQPVQGKKKKGKGRPDGSAKPTGEPVTPAPASVPTQVKPKPSGAGEGPIDQSKPSASVVTGMESLAISSPPPKQQPQQASGRGKKGKGGKGPEPAKAPESAPVAESAEAPSAKAITKELVKKGAAEQSYIIPKRKHQVIQHKQNYVDRKIRIDVNYLPLSFTKPELSIFHYDVAFKPERPKGLFRRALDEMRRIHFPTRFPAFDGSKNLYAGGFRLFPGDVIRDTVKILDPEDNNREREFDVTIKIASDKLNLSTLRKYMEGKGTSAEQPQDVIQATDIALRGGLFNRFLPVGRSFFSGPRQVDLGGGLELWDGFFQSAIMAWKPYLNVDVANKGFPIHQTVIDYLRSLYAWNEAELQRGLEENHTRELQSYIRGLKVQYCIRGDTAKRTFKVNGLGQNADDYKFECNGQKINVTQYFHREKRTPLQYPKLPLLHVGPPQKNIMVPIEFCTIIGRQIVMRKLDEKQTSIMVRNAAQPTDVRRRRIMDNIRAANYAQDPTLNEFGIRVEPKFASVDSVVLTQPVIEYRNNNEQMPRNGVWRMDRSHFFNSPALTSWAVLVKDSRTRPDAVRRTVDLLIQGGRAVGLQVSPPKDIVTDAAFRDLAESKIVDNLVDLNRKHGPLQIVLVIMSAQPSDLYSRIKRASELRAGILTQCVKSNTVFKMNPMTANNILLKINAKIAGINHTLAKPQQPAIFKAPVMFVGADVTHPSPGVDGSPSIAAVAASFDRTGFKYNMLYRLQPSRMEMIQDLEEVMCRHLEHFMKMNGTLPVRIMYYRDGVSEGQFNAILCIELRALRSACCKIASAVGREYKPGITFLVVQKRHHTRFFPDPKDGDGGRNNNVLAGTVVDREITHPTELDFYLVSHQSIQGTARPTKYHVLWDDNDFEEDDLEVLTYYLCYMFSRCNRSVSYPAPTYYAHLGAFRARAYWDGQRIEMGRLREEQERRGTIQCGITDRSPMFFV